MHGLVIVGSLIFAYTMSKAAPKKTRPNSQLPGYDVDEEVAIDMVDLDPKSGVVAGSGAQ